MCEKKPGILELMGKEEKQQQKKTHQAIITAFKPKRGTPKNGKSKAD
jgi:hypothetical protein